MNWNTHNTTICGGKRSFLYVNFSHFSSFNFHKYFFICCRPICNVSNKYQLHVFNHYHQITLLPLQINHLYVGLPYIKKAPTLTKVPIHTVSRTKKNCKTWQYFIRWPQKYWYGRWNQLTSSSSLRDITQTRVLNGGHFKIKEYIILHEGPH